MRSLRGSGYRNKLCAGVVLVAVSLAMAACGSSSSGTTTTTSGSTTSSTAAPSSTNALSGAPAWLLVVVHPLKTNAMLHNEVPAANKTATNIVAMDTTYAPDEFLMNGVTIVGFDADLARALAVVLGINIKLQTATFSTIIPGLTDGKYQIGDSSFTDTLARQKQVNFVDYFVAGEGFYVPTSSTFSAAKGLASLCGKIVAVEAGTTEQSDAQAQSKKCSLTVKTFPDQSSANVAVSSGQAQVGFVDSQVAAYIAAQSKGEFKYVGPAVEVAPYGIALPKNGLDKPIQGAMQLLMNDGVYLAILKHWGVQAGAIKKATIDGATS